MYKVPEKINRLHVQNAEFKPTAEVCNTTGPYLRPAAYPILTLPDPSVPTGILSVVMLNHRVQIFGHMR